MSIDGLYFAVVLIGMVAATVLTRSAFLLLPTRWQLPPAVLSALRYAPIAAIAAIVAPDLIQWRAISVSVEPATLMTPKLLAALLAGLIHWRYANMLLTITAGMATFWLLRYVLSLGILV